MEISQIRVTLATRWHQSAPKLIHSLRWICINQHQWKHMHCITTVSCLRSIWYIFNKSLQIHTSVRIKIAVSGLLKKTGSMVWLKWKFCSALLSVYVFQVFSKYFIMLCSDAFPQPSCSSSLINNHPSCPHPVATAPIIPIFILQSGRLCWF